MDAWIGPLSSHIGMVTACLLLASFVIAFRPLPQAKNCLWPIVFETPRRSVSIARRLWKHPHHLWSHIYNFTVRHHLASAGGLPLWDCSTFRLSTLSPISGLPHTHREAYSPHFIKTPQFCVY